jgi:hypothetical protein
MRKQAPTSRVSAWLPINIVRFADYPNGGLPNILSAEEAYKKALDEAVTLAETCCIVGFF